MPGLVAVPGLAALVPALSRQQVMSQIGILEVCLSAQQTSDHRVSVEEHKLALTLQRNINTIKGRSQNVCFSTISQEETFNGWKSQSATAGAAAGHTLGADNAQLVLLFSIVHGHCYRHICNN